MKVLLLQNIRGVGQKNEIKELKEGFVRNALLPKGVVKILDKKLLFETQKRKEQEEKKLQNHFNQLQNLKEKLGKMVLCFDMKIGKKEEVFSSITKKDIEEKIKSKITLPEFEVELEKPIRALGEFVAILNFGEGIKSQIKIIAQKQS